MFFERIKKMNAEATFMLAQVQRRNYPPLGASLQFASKGANIRVHPLTNSKSFCDFLRILREKKIISRRICRHTQNSQTCAEKDKQGINILLNKFKNKIR
jgi:hypothetical protein